MLRQLHITSVLSTILLIFLFMVSGETRAAGKSLTPYVIVLASAPGTNLAWKPKTNSVFEGRTLFVTRTTVKGKQWERLNLGFFDSRQQAVLVLNNLQKIYPGAWLRAATADELKKTSGQAVSAVAATIPSSSKKTTPVNNSTLTDKQLDSLMQRAKNDFKNENYSQAIRYLTAVISAGQHKYSMEALELLGLSRQRNGQNAHAVAIYQEYLEKYPTSEGAIRVNQRLTGLLTSTKPPRDKIHMEADQDMKISETTTYGSFSQFYAKDISEADDIGTVVTRSMFITYLDFTTLHQTNKFDHRFQFIAEDTYDFIDESEANLFRFIELYYDLGSRRTGTSGRIGRQTLRLGGIVRRFDGFSAGYQLTPGMRLNALAGYPVDIADYSSINQHKSFYGFTFETGTFLEYWDMNLFYFDQSIDGVDDLNSIGTEVRYNDRTTSLFGMIDYDLDYNDFNILQLNANLLFDRGRTAYMNAFMRKVPSLATSNALIGRPEGSIEELLENLNIEQIYQLARDRTADSATITLGGSQPISEKLQVNADITFARAEGTIDSGGVPATPSTGTDYYISTQIVGNNLILKRDTGVLGIRYLDTSFGNTWSFIANTRIPVSRSWRVNPRFQYDIRNASDGDTQNRLRLIFRTDYRYLNKIRLDFEIGYGTVRDDANTLQGDANSLFFTAGYRWDF